MVSDPLKVGGFQPGTKFSDLDLAYMLINHAFEMGTALKHRQFGTFKVIPGVKTSKPYRMENTKWMVKVTSGPRLCKYERAAVRGEAVT